MSLLQNEEFAIYQLRTSYLAHIHDGIGERLINVDTTFLNDPAFRAAGWTPNVSEIKRTYSPPIPTSGTSEYFQAPPRSAGLSRPGFGDDDEETGMVTGGGSNETTIGPAPVGKRRRRKEQLEEDDSSDLSDESTEEAESTLQRPANQIRFAKMPVRNRSGSSPIRTRAESSPLRNTNQTEGPSLMVTSPSRPPDSHRLRTGSLGAMEAVNARSRRGTATSSEVSSEGDLDPSVFRRKQVNAATRAGRTLTDQIQEEGPDDEMTRPSSSNSVLSAESDTQDGVEDVDSDDDSLASGFSEPGSSNSLLEEVEPITSSPLMPRKASASHNASPKRNRGDSNSLQDLPPPRPISTILPVSALAAAIKAKNKKPTSPFDRFTALSGKNESDALYIKIFVPNSDKPEDPMEMQLRKVTNDGNAVTVADAIGFSLLRHAEEEYKPAIAGSKLNVNRWTLRIVEDGEVDFDFPALGRTRPMSDFTSNNNRPTRGRQRDKPWDEFALVEANEEQFKENEELTPSFSEDAAATITASSTNTDEQTAENSTTTSSTGERSVVQSTTSLAHQQAPRQRPHENPITAPRFAAAFRKDSTTALDMPTSPSVHAATRTGAPRTLTIHYTDNDLQPRLMRLEVTTDTYLSEVFHQICQRLNVDKGLYVLKVTNTTTIAPSDRTVEALGAQRNSLDLARRRFIGDGTFGLSGSPGSTSPNAPLLLTTTGTPTTKRQRGRLDRGNAGMQPHPLAQQADLLGLGSGAAGGPSPFSYRRYNVVRRQPMSFTPNHPRVLALDGEYMHIMPAEGKGDAGTGAGKSKPVHFSSVIGCKVNRKHPKTFRVVVWRERERKNYDFEAGSREEAEEIVGEIDKGVARLREAMGM